MVFGEFADGFGGGRVRLPLAALSGLAHLGGCLLKRGDSR